MDYKPTKLTYTIALNENKTISFDYFAIEQIKGEVLYDSKENKDSTGLMIWPGSNGLNLLLIELYEKVIKDRVIFEIGCGLLIFFLKNMNLFIFFLKVVGLMVYYV